VRLGELEKAVLQHFWSVDSADVKHVHQALDPKGLRSLNTVQSAMDRLFKKGLLKRDKVGHAFVYRAGQPRNIFLAKLMRSVTADFISEEQDFLAAFSSLAENLDDAQLEELEQLIERRRNDSKAGG
jgi:predicted transcriptional regulator